MKTTIDDTYHNLITSNESFSNAIKSGSTPDIDEYIRFELVFFYLKINQQYLTSLDDHEELIELLHSKNTTMNAQYIINGNQIYSIDYLIKLIMKVEEYKKRIEPSCEIIPMPHIEYEPVEIEIDKEPTIIPLKDQLSQFLTMSDRRSIFEHTLMIDRETRPYIDSVRQTYTNEISSTIISILNKEDKELDPITLSLISSYINFIPLFRKDKIPYEKLNIPQNIIGVAKTKYEDEEVCEKINQIDNLERASEELKNRKRLLEKYCPHEKGKIALLEFKIRAMERKEFEVDIESYFERTKPEKYNKNFVTNLLKCFESGYVDIDFLYKDPLVRIFDIEENNVTFYAAIHLSSLLNIVRPESLQIPKKYTKKITSQTM